MTGEVHDGAGRPSIYLGEGRRGGGRRRRRRERTTRRLGRAELEQRVCEKAGKRLCLCQNKPWCCGWVWG